MIIETLKTLFGSGLQKLKSEIEAYQNENRIWQVEKAISNSAGNLCLHVTGSLNTYIGAALAKTNYIRNRDLEFSLKGIPRAELIRRIEETMLVVEKGLNNLPPDQLKADFPVVIWDKATEMEYTLVHFIGHLNYHLGQINYHRRLLDSK
jgi:Protein of unknown function (DUF1572)